MPILAPEPDIFPDDLLDHSELSSHSHRRWWAMYTLARREKELVRRLRAMRIAHYAPMIPRRNRSPNGRVRTAYVPLFASYVFMYGDEDNRYQALTTNCISRWLKVVDGHELEHDLRQIRCLVVSDAPLTPEARLRAGMRVRIRSGALAGLEGVVIKRQNQERLLVAVNSLMQGVSVLLDGFQVERID